MSLHVSCMRIVRHHKFTWHDKGLKYTTHQGGSYEGVSAMHSPADEPTFSFEVFKRACTRRRGTVASSAKRSSTMSAADFRALQRGALRAAESAARHRSAKASLCSTSASSSASAWSVPSVCIVHGAAYDGIWVESVLWDMKGCHEATRLYKSLGRLRVCMQRLQSSAYFISPPKCMP